MEIYYANLESIFDEQIYLNFILRIITIFIFILSVHESPTFGGSVAGKPTFSENMKEKLFLRLVMKGS